ncbi:hypothetical protein DEJ16_02535 [Curtobacterium sp. MCJR17_055]|uniref:hypothetical protein n=1 Tax=unclassified Curtobacterium TaxID=257496 RepID=UPI000D9DB714|nr:MULTISPECIES: hypothetical protein [unclassified Curtobacterium]PYY36767.1 hypothetical protein DEI87_03610 [Curtobacterium sp. MCBD17_029]PYY58572.1 hypothetical protein DEJ16_02535 [Curtobacterium sp. MCJR17_055]PYY59886.1 hypothetical protein DEJ26_08375 [Curtobacterium sp. MCPF17_015]WIB36565.1 hypothetical protein DEJ15_05460 [Curtobacterium sp. MCJR17_043]
MTTVPEDLRTFATFDGHGGKVSKRVEVLDHRPPVSPDGRYDGLVAVRGEHPLGALDERAADDSAELTRGVASIGWVDPATLRDWYRPDRVVVSLLDARRSGLEPGVYADSRGRGRVRIDGQEAHLGPDGRPAFRALAGTAEAPKVDVPLPMDQAVRLVVVTVAGRDGDDLGGTAPAHRTSTGAAGVEVVTTPVAPLLAPGEYPEYADDVPGLPPRPASGRVRVSASVLLDGALHPVDRLDEQANTLWIERGGRVVPIAASDVGGDLVRYTATPV